MEMDIFSIWKIVPSRKCLILRLHVRVADRLCQPVLSLFFFLADVSNPF
jgi:hypothetical protein